MANQDELLNLQSLNLREDEATTKGTRAVRYLVQRLQEANSNPALGPTVQALLQHQLVGDISPRGFPTKRSCCTYDNGRFFYKRSGAHAITERDSCGTITKASTIVL